MTAILEIRDVGQFLDLHEPANQNYSKAHLLDLDNMARFHRWPFVRQISAETVRAMSQPWWYKGRHP